MRPHHPAGMWDGPTASAAPRSMTGRELLLRSAFHVASDREGPGPGLAAWGRVAAGGFNGEPTTDGEVLTGTLGADADFGQVLAGVAVSLSEGDGTFDSPAVDKGGIESTVRW